MADHVIGPLYQQPDIRRLKWSDLDPVRCETFCPVSVRPQPRPACPAKRKHSDPRCQDACAFRRFKMVDVPFPIDPAPARVPFQT